MLGTMLELLIWVPPEDAFVLNQPTNVNPGRALGVGSVPKVLPDVRLEVGGEPEPPL